MRILGIFTIMIFLWTLGYSQENSDQIQNNDKEAKHSASKKIIKANDIREGVPLKNGIESNKEKLNKVDIQKLQQVVEIEKTNNVQGSSKKQNKIFGSSKNSGEEIKLEKGKNNNSISNNELRKNLEVKNKL